MEKSVFKMPVPVKISGRASSITNAFVHGIIPVVEPDEEEIDDVLNTLGMTRDTICCAYCGDKYSEWDHFRPLIKDKQPTGYISEIHNLVPACGKCNQSKGNRNWKEWIYSDASLSPKAREIADLDARVSRLTIFERKYTVKKYDFQNIVGDDLWQHHWDNWKKLMDLMKESQSTSDEIKQRIKDSIDEK